MQPTYLPWIGYFDLMDQADVFVFLDNVQFAKRSWQQRNRIKTPRGLEWLTVPVNVSGRYHQLISDVEIADQSYVTRHLSAIRRNYACASYFKSVYSYLEGLFHSASKSRRLLHLNAQIITAIAEIMGLQKPIIMASDITHEGKRSERLALICSKLNADTYLSALGSAEYLLQEVHEFSKRGIRVLFHHYEHPHYNQLYPPFMPYASIIDLIFNEGFEILRIIRSGRRVPLELHLLRRENNLINNIDM